MTLYCDTPSSLSDEPYDRRQSAGDKPPPYARCGFYLLSRPHCGFRPSLLYQHLLKSLNDVVGVVFGEYQWRGNSNSMAVAVVGQQTKIKHFAAE